MHIKQTNKGEMSVLVKFGHRAFVEIDPEMNHIGYFVEVSGPTEDKQIRRKRDHVTSQSAMLQWSNKPIPYKRGSIVEVAKFVSEQARGSINRSYLVKELMEHFSLTRGEASNRISTLCKDDLLREVSNG